MTRFSHLQTPVSVATAAEPPLRGRTRGRLLPHPSHVDPALQQPGPLVGLQGGVAQAGGDDAVGDGVELGHGGPDGGGQVLLALLVPLGPDPPQAVVGHHLLKQVLEGEVEACEPAGEGGGLFFYGSKRPQFYI